jgi:hypothetical protein
MQPMTEVISAPACPSIQVAPRAQANTPCISSIPRHSRLGRRTMGSRGFGEYGYDYYAAFVLDFGGNNIEECYFGEKAPSE